MVISETATMAIPDVDERSELEIWFSSDAGWVTAGPTDIERSVCAACNESPTLIENQTAIEQVIATSFRANKRCRPLLFGCLFSIVSTHFLNFSFLFISIIHSFPNDVSWHLRRIIVGYARVFFGCFRSFFVDFSRSINNDMCESPACRNWRFALFRPTKTGPIIFRLSAIGKTDRRATILSHGC